MIYTDVTSRALTYLLKRPGLHIDMTESIYRGLAEIRYAEPDGVLQLVHAHSTGAPVLYQLSADTREAAEKLLPLITLKIPVVAHQACCVEAVTARRDQLVSSCIQALWPTFAPPPANPAVEIWPLDLGDLPVVEQHYDLIENPTELAERITSGGMYGACVEDRLAGFIGVHTEGAMGMLTVLEEYRGRGIGSALLTYLVRQELRRGHVPYSQIFRENRVSMALQKKSGDGASAGNHLVAAAEAVNGGMAQLQREQMRKLRDKSWKKNGQKAGDGVLFI